MKNSRSNVATFYIPDKSRTPIPRYPPPPFQTNPLKKHNDCLSKYLSSVDPFDLKCMALPPPFSSHSLPPLSRNNTAFNFIGCYVETFFRARSAFCRREKKKKTKQSERCESSSEWGKQSNLNVSFV